MHIKGIYSSYLNSKTQDFESLGSTSTYFYFSQVLLLENAYLRTQLITEFLPLGKVKCYIATRLCKILPMKNFLHFLLIVPRKGKSQLQNVIEPKQQLPWLSTLDDYPTVNHQMKAITTSKLPTSARPWSKLAVYTHTKANRGSSATTCIEFLFPKANCFQYGFLVLFTVYLSECNVLQFRRLTSLHARHKLL